MTEPHEVAPDASNGKSRNHCHHNIMNDFSFVFSSNTFNITLLTIN